MLSKLCKKKYFVMIYNDLILQVWTTITSYFLNICFYFVPSGILHVRSSQTSWKTSHLIWIIRIFWLWSFQNFCLRNFVQSFFDWFIGNIKDSTIITWCRAWVGNLKQRVPITSKSSNFKGETQHYIVKLPKSAGARQYCPKIPWVPGTLGTRAISSLVIYGSSKKRLKKLPIIFHRENK